jgi:hypothetical protein
MYDSCLCFEYLLGEIQPLMEAFMLRFLMDHPEHLQEGFTITGLLEVRAGLKFSEVAPLSRSVFFQRSLPGIGRFLALKRGG